MNCADVQATLTSLSETAYVPHNSFPPAIMTCPNSTDNHESLCPDEPNDEIDLSLEQRAVFEKVKNGHSIFFTGAAGTGKSYLLRRIVEWARDRQRATIAVTASTGMAAINVGGSTIYSWAGIGLEKRDPEALWKTLVNASYTTNPKTGEEFLIPDSPVRRWQDCQTLILDEGQWSRVGYFHLSRPLMIHSLDDRW